MAAEKKCVWIETCPMFQYFRLESSKKVFVINYCEGNFEKCERKKLKDAGQTVPEKLLPNGRYLQ